MPKPEDRDKSAIPPIPPPPVVPRQETPVDRKEKAAEQDKKDKLEKLKEKYPGPGRDL